MTWDDEEAEFERFEARRRRFFRRVALAVLAVLALGTAALARTAWGLF